MKKFYIITNPLKDKDFKITDSICRYLREQGRECAADRDFTDSEEPDKTADIPEDCDCVLVLGGDGTLIRAAREVVRKGLPLLGINLGTLGFLTETDTANATEALERLIKEEYEIEERMMLYGRMLSKGGEVSGNLALNDIVISRSGSLRVVNFKIYVNGEYLHSYNADGVIVSTPTGSTGYSLSAGGPVVEPSASMIILTPICPHSLNTRSIILSSKDQVEIEIGPGRKREKEAAAAVFDGDIEVLMETGDRILIHKAERKTKIVKISKVSFLEVLRRKMGESND